MLEHGGAKGMETTLMCNRKLLEEMKKERKMYSMSRTTGTRKWLPKSSAGSQTVSSSCPALPSVQSSESSKEGLKNVNMTGKSQRGMDMHAKMSTQIIKRSATLPTEFATAEFTAVTEPPIKKEIKIVTTAEDNTQQNVLFRRQKAMGFLEDAIVSNNPTMLRQAVVHVMETGVPRHATVSLPRLQVHADCLEAAEFLRTAVACGSKDTSQCRRTLTRAVEGDMGRGLTHLTTDCDVKRRLCDLLACGCVDDLFVVICECLIALLQYELRIYQRRCRRLSVLDLEKKAERVKEHLAELIDNKMASDEDAIARKIWKPLFQKKLLLEIKMTGGCPESLLDMIENSRGPTWVDCSLWERAPKQELLQVARILHARGGLLAWPSASMLESLPSGFDATEHEQLRSDASHAALRVLRSAIDQTRDAVTQAPSVQISLGKIAYLERIIHYAEEFTVASEEIESARRVLSELKAIVAAKKKSSMTRNVKKLKTTTSFLGLAFQSEHIQCNDASNALVGMGSTPEQADEFLSYADCERKGFINFLDFTQVFERRLPAGPREMCRFVDFIRQLWGSYEAAFYAMAANITNDMQVSLPEFAATLEAAGWKDVPLRAIFVSLDPMKRGYLDLDGLRAAALFEGIQILDYWQAVRDDILKRFGTVKKAMKVWDDNKSGQLSYEEFQKAMLGLDVPNACMLKGEMFHFLDTDATGIMQTRELESLQNFDATHFMRTLTNLRMELIHKFGDLETAFGKLDTSKTGQISLKEFKHGCQKIKLSEFSDIDPGMLYHFLDRSGNNQLNKNEFSMLNYFHLPRAAADSKNHRLFLKNVFGTTDPKTAFIQFQAKVNEATSNGCNNLGQKIGTRPFLPRL